MAEPVYGARYLKPAGSEAGDATIVVYSSAPASSSAAAHGGDGRALLADGDVDAADLLLRVAGLPVRLLVDDRVDRDRRLAGLAVADDQLALAAADGDHRVDGLDAGLQRLLDALALHHARGLQLERAALGGLDGAEAVDRLAQRVDHAAEVVVADGDGEDLAGAADLHALLDALEVTEHDDADLVLVEVQREAAGAVAEDDELVRHDVRQALDVRDAVGGVGDGADLGRRGRLRGRRRRRTPRARHGSHRG